MVKTRKTSAKTQSGNSAKPATKQDLRLVKQDLRLVKQDVKLVKRELKKDMMVFKKETEKRFDGVDKRLDNTDSNFSKLLREIKEQEEETRRHFDVIAEQLRHDLLYGAVNDKVEQNTDRIEKIEKHVGLVSA